MPLRTRHSLNQLLSASGKDDADFDKVYPPDPLGEEASPDARIWTVYRDESTVHDTDCIENWNKTLDVLLIFAGLFSAVTTAFVIESSKTLQQDYTEYAARLLFLALTSRNGSGNFELPDVSNVTSPDDFHAPRHAVWINGLWYTSLALALVVALVAILVKQWLATFTQQVSAPKTDDRAWARARTLYSTGLDRWGVHVIISFLPVLLHASLFSFMAGVVTFLWHIHRGLSVVVLGLTATSGAFYATFALLPLLFDDCPTQTIGHPIYARTAVARTTKVIWRTLTFIMSIPFSLFISVMGLVALPIVRFLVSIPRARTTARALVLRLRWESFRGALDSLSSIIGMSFLHKRFGRLPEPRQLDGEALRWLIDHSYSTKCISVAIQAIGAFADDASQVPFLRKVQKTHWETTRFTRVVTERLYSEMSVITFRRLSGVDDARNYARFSRACLAMFRLEDWRFERCFARLCDDLGDLAGVDGIPLLQSFALLLQAQAYGSVESTLEQLRLVVKQIVEAYAPTPTHASLVFISRRCLALVQKFWDEEPRTHSELVHLCHAARLHELAYDDLRPIKLFLVEAFRQLAGSPAPRKQFLQRDDVLLPRWYMSIEERSKYVCTELWCWILFQTNVTNETTIVISDIAECASALLQYYNQRQRRFWYSRDYSENFIRFLMSVQFASHTWTLSAFSPIAELALIVLDLRRTFGGDDVFEPCAQLLYAGSAVIDWHLTVPVVPGSAQSTIPSQTSVTASDVASLQYTRNTVMRILDLAIAPEAKLPRLERFGADLRRVTELWARWAGLATRQEDTPLSLLLEYSAPPAPQAPNALNTTVPTTPWQCLLKNEDDAMRLRMLTIADRLASALRHRDHTTAYKTQNTASLHQAFFGQGDASLECFLLRVWGKTDRTPRQSNAIEASLKRLLAHALEIDPDFEGRCNTYLNSLAQTTGHAVAIAAMRVALSTVQTQTTCSQCQ